MKKPLKLSDYKSRRGRERKEAIVAANTHAKYAHTLIGLPSHKPIHEFNSFSVIVLIQSKA